MVANEYSSTELINTQLSCDYTRAHAGHVMLFLASPVLQHTFHGRSARKSFSQVQHVFIVEHYLATRSYLTCRNEFRDTFSSSSVQNKSTVSPLLNLFRDTRSLQDRNRPDDLRCYVTIVWTISVKHFYPLDFPST
jgi:hypothetical protein